MIVLSFKNSQIDSKVYKGATNNPNDECMIGRLNVIRKGHSTLQRSNHDVCLVFLIMDAIKFEKKNQLGAFFKTDWEQTSIEIHYTIKLFLII